MLGYFCSVPLPTPLRANPARNGEPGCAGLGCRRSSFSRLPRISFVGGTAGPSTPPEAGCARDDNSRERVRAPLGMTDQRRMRAPLGVTIAWVELAFRPASKPRHRSLPLCRRPARSPPGRSAIGKQQVPPLGLKPSVGMTNFWGAWDAGLKARSTRTRRVSATIGVLRLALKRSLRMTH